MNRTIREYTPADRHAITALSLRAWAPVFDSIQSALRGSGVYERQYPNGWAGAQSTSVGDACDSEALHVWVAEEDGAVAGFTAVQLHEVERMGEIYMLAVDPGYQRRGIAADLTSAAVSWMRGRGMTTAMVETGGDPGHAPARSTYEASGFHLLPIARYFQAL